MDDAARQLVRRRAGERCEYCHLPQKVHDEKFSIDHIRARTHGGDDAVTNLALCCLRCNLHKGTNLIGVDPVYDSISPLFDPRTQNWDEHFRMEAAVIVGLTACGRATVQVLRVNASERVQLRQSLIAEGLLGTEQQSRNVTGI